MYHELLWYVKLFVKVWFFIIISWTAWVLIFDAKLLCGQIAFRILRTVKNSVWVNYFHTCIFRKCYFIFFWMSRFYWNRFLLIIWYRLWSLLEHITYFFAKIFIRFGFWKRLFQLISYITETEQKVNDKKLVWIGPLLNLSLKLSLIYLRSLSDESFSKSKLYKNVG